MSAAAEDRVASLGQRRPNEPVVAPFVDEPLGGVCVGVQPEDGEHERLPRSGLDSRSSRICAHLAEQDTGPVLADGILGGPNRVETSET